MNVMGVYAPGAGASLYGVLFPITTAVEGGGSVGEGAFGLGPDYDSAKVAWYSPRVGGARVGVSFTPEGGADDAANGSRGDAGTANAASVVVGDDGEPDVKPASVSAQQSEVLAIGGNWTGDFSGASVSVGAGYAAASVEAGTAADDDQEEWIIGLRVTMDSISVGGNYSVDNTGKSGNFDRTTLALGATYGMGPVTYGVTYASTSREQGAGNQDLDSDALSVGATYALGSGLSVSAEIQFWDVSSAAGENEATVGLIGTTVRF